MILSKKSLKAYLKKLNMKIKVFLYIRGTGKILNKIMNQLLLISYFLSKDSEEITLLYKSEYNLERENKVLLLMINDDDNEILLFCGKKQIRIMSI